MSEFKKGDRVRVTYEGTVSGVVGNLGLDIRGADGGGAFIPAKGSEVTLLERPVEPLAPGSVVQHRLAGSNGHYFVNENGVPHYVSPYADWENHPPESRGTTRTATDLARLVESNPKDYVLIYDGSKK